METMHPAAKILIPLMAFLVGAGFALTGVLRPPLLWESGKLQLGRRMLGDGPMAGVFIVFGCVLLAVAVFSFIRLRGR
jgi:hypothetical protein